MSQEQQTSHKLENERWEVSLSNKEKFIIDGGKYQALDKIIQSGQFKFVKFDGFTINTAHIISIVCVDKGLVYLPKLDKYRELSDEEREKNIEKIQEMKRKFGWLN